MKIECVCPPKADGQPRHPAGDTIKLRPKLDFRSSLTMRNAIAVAKAEDPDCSVEEILAILTEHYLLAGIESWSLLDVRGKAIPVSKAAIREFLDGHPDEAMEVGDEADGLYAQAVMRPLLQRASSSSPPTPTNGSTSPTMAISPPRRKPSKPSSTTTTQMAATGPTSSSPGGVYSSSRNSA
jgi:hypothetical protein